VLNVDPDIPLRSYLEGAKLARGKGFPEHLLDLTGKELQEAAKSGQVTPEQVRKLSKVIEQGIRLMGKHRGK